VTGLTVQVTAALERSVLPSVIARGGAVRVAAAGNGVVILEVTGSPGAVFPLASRIEAVIRAAVPGITAVRLVTPGTDPAGPPPMDAVDLAGAAQAIVDAEVNPAIAAHRGRVTVTGVTDDGWVRIRLDGGCQGAAWPR
jgi:Fe-S cluster biogenesis protein NfuA